MRFGLFLCFSLLLFYVFGNIAGAKVAGQGCLNGECHQELTVVKYMHGPVAAEMAGANGCKMCHVPAGAECSAGRGGIFKARSQGLCLICHAKGNSSRHSSKESEAKCLQCHDPHGSAVSRYMLRSGRE